jgi:hypothetical protein
MDCIWSVFDFVVMNINILIAMVFLVIFYTMLKSPSKRPNYPPPTLYRQGPLDRYYARRR